MASSSTTLMEHHPPARSQQCDAYRTDDERHLELVAQEVRVRLKGREYDEGSPYHGENGTDDLHAHLPVQSPVNVLPHDSTSFNPTVSRCPWPD